MAEAILRHLAGASVDVVSAGSRPATEIHPLARDAVRKIFGLEMSGQRPKPVDDFVGASFDYVITVCDRAAETCPSFPGAPEVIRWSLPDPAEASGTADERRRVFEDSAKDLLRRIRLLLSLPEIAKKVPPAR